MSEPFQPQSPDDPMVMRLLALRDEAESAGYELLAYLIDVAVEEAERLVERQREGGRTRS